VGLDRGRWKRVRFAGSKAATGLVIWLMMVSACALLGAAAERGTDQIFFSKSFPGSKPQYFDVTVDSKGKAMYREDPSDKDPLEFTLSEDNVREVFGLAQRLERFGKSFQSKLKVAFTGTKTLRYIGASGETTETEFTYSTNEDAQAIVDWFEKAGETERYRIELERVVQFDPLGVNKALLLFQSSFDAGRVVAADQFLPVLRTIAEQSKFMHMARARAAALVERIEVKRP
jgi:hypothetical protein